MKRLLVSAACCLVLAGSVCADSISPVIPKGEELVRDGVPVRFWGVNVNLQPWNTHESIDRMVKRIRAVGFNSIRLWPNWSTFYGTDVKRNVQPPAQGFSFVNYKKGDGRQLDLFDRMVARCRENGLSIYMTALMYYPPIYAAPAFADLVKTDPADRAQWMDAVSSARWEKGIYDPWWGLHYIDERFQAIWMKHAGLFLNHVNPYTGLRYADDNNIVMWQLHNESRFIDKFMLGNEYRIPSSKGRPFPVYFRKKVSSLYNRFLADKYQSDDALRAAWGQLQPGESLEKRNIDAGARDLSNNIYNAARVADFTEFTVKLVKDWNERFTSFLRSQAKGEGIAVTSIATDTFAWPSLPYYATLYEGGMISFGNYPDPRKKVRRTTRASAPWTPRLGYTGAWAPFDFTRPYGKPASIYEINYNQFALYDAELPWLAAVFASWQNINGVFFYFWNAPKKSEQPAPYGENVFAYRGKEIWGDEVFTSALHAAGEVFLNRMLPTAENPALFSFSEDAAIDPAWSSWSYTGHDSGGLTLKGISAGQVRDMRKYIVGTAFSSGARVRVNAEQKADVEVTGNRPVKAALRRDIVFAPGVRWEGSSERLIIDRPDLKVFAGFPGSNRIAWSDGFELSEINIEELGEGALHDPFLVVAFISEDGLPLVQSKQIRFAAVSHSYHQGMKWHDGLLDPGDGPVITRRVSGKVEMPHNDSRLITFRDFSFKTLGRQDGKKGFLLPSGLPVYDALITTQ